MSKNLADQLQELLDASVIDEETAGRIRSYYEAKPSAGGHRLNLVYGILGALLVGSGIILLVAHNWDDLSRPLKTFLAILPLILSLGLCVYALMMHRGESTWLEPAAILYFFSTGAALALIAQIYHHEADYNSFVLSWVLFTLPFVWLMPSYITALLTTTLISSYGLDYFFSGSNSQFPVWYWAIWSVMLIFTLYYRRLKGFSNAYVLLLWVLAVSVIFRFISFGTNTEEMLFPAYLALFSLMAIAGGSKEFEGCRLMQNPLLVLSSAGVLVIFYILGYKELWMHEMFDSSLSQILHSREFAVAIVLLIAVLLLTIKGFVGRFHPSIHALFFFIASYLLAIMYHGIGALLCNVWIIITGLYYIIRGNRQNNLGWLNYGMLIIGILIVMRFFDENLPYLWRGIFMLAFGIGFFVANYRLISQRKQQKQ
jgi:uncharacterized membrane protein